MPLGPHCTSPAVTVAHTPSSRWEAGCAASPTLFTPPPPPPPPPLPPARPPPPRRPPRDPPSASPPAAQIKILKSLTKKANRILNRKEVKRAARALKAAIAAAGGKAAFYKLHPEAKPVPNPPKELSEEAAAARREKRARKKEKKRRKELEKQQKEEEMRVGG